MPSGIERLIFPHMPEGARWGFTLERWEGSVLERAGNQVICWVLHAHPEGHGHCRTLIAGIERDGLQVVVPCPMQGMVEILKHYNFKPQKEMLYGTDVWIRSTVDSHEQDT